MSAIDNRKRHVGALMPGKFDLSASMMCAKLGELSAEVGRLEQAGVDSFHFDVMDGHFVPNLALSPATIAALRPASKLRFVAHLMVEDPAAFIRPMALAGCDEFVFHIEASRYPRRIKNEIEDSGMVAGIAINPATSISALESVADLPSATIMTVEPGFAGQDFIATSPERVNKARMLFGDSALIAADGHINPTTARLLAAAGANGFVCGTKSLFQSDHEVSVYAQALKALRAALSDSD